MRQLVGLWIAQAISAVFGMFCLYSLAFGQAANTDTPIGWHDAASGLGAALALVVGLWSKHQDTMIATAAKEARAAMDKALEVERELLRRYRPSAETAAAMETALAPLKKELHDMKGEFVTMRTQFIGALLQLRQNGKPPTIGEI